MADPQRFVEDLEGRIAHETEALDRAFFPEPVVVADGTSAVIDCGGCRGLKALFEEGSPSYVECDEEGNPVAGVSPVELENGVGVPRAELWRWVKVTATAGSVQVCPF